MHRAIRLTVLAAIASVLLAQQFAIRDTNGAVHTPSEWRGHPAIVLFFAAPECPLSNGYVPEMNRIQEAYVKRGVLTFAVQADIGMSPDTAASYARDYYYEFPMLLDVEQRLVRLAGATVTPQAAVLSGEGKLLYLGRVDNRVEDFGQRRTQITSTDLRDALDAVLAGQSVAHPVTKSIGCAIQRIHGEKL
jgi:thiol-disulfide isomerase/thioredoxin